MTANFERGMYRRMRVHVLPTQQFKTYSLFLFAGLPLRAEQLTENALLPYVLRRGTAATPSTIHLREKLDDLYGAGFGFDIVKRGDTQLLQFRMDVIHDRFVANRQGQATLLSEALRLFGEVVTQPALDEGGNLREDYFSTERQTLSQRLASLSNDRTRYAAQRCVAEMFKGQPYALSALGDAEQLDQLKVEQLKRAHQRMLAEAAFDLYVVGDTSLEHVLGLLSSFQLPATASTDYAPAAPLINLEPARSVTEEADVLQSKLNFGLRLARNSEIPARKAQSDFHATLLLYNGILGGYPHSKLFTNVREKASLAYYASSSFDRVKQFGTIQAGIELAKFEQAKQIIEQQLEAMRQGKIEPVELEQTKAMLVNDLTEMSDSAAELVSFDFGKVFNQSALTREQLIDDIRTMKVDHIQKFAERVEIDLVYLLKGKG